MTSKSERGPPAFLLLGNVALTFLFYSELKASLNVEDILTVCLEGAILLKVCMVFVYIFGVGLGFVFLFVYGERLLFIF